MTAQTQTHIPAHLLAILAGKGPSIAHVAPPVQSRGEPKAPRHQEGAARIDAQEWEAPESHGLTDNEALTGSVTIGEL